MLDEILVIQESIPIFYYNRDPTIALKDDWYVLQSGFFVALSQFANEMSHDRLKYIILENRLYALDEVSNVMLVFGDKEKMDQTVVDDLKNNLTKASNYLNYLFEKYNVGNSTPNFVTLNKIGLDFGEYLKQENLIEDDMPFDPKESRSLMQKFIFKSIGYKAGQCNIGRAERQKRLIMGIMFFIPAIIGALVIYFVPAISAYWMFTLAVPLFMGFFGLFQYLFKFCAINGLTKKYDMR